MRRKQKITAVLTILAFSAAVCSGCAGAVNVDDAINKAFTSAQQVTNYEAHVQIDITMDNQGQTMVMPASVDLIAFDDPFMIKMMATTSVTPASTAESYIIKQDEKMITYSKAKDKWTSRESTSDDGTLQLYNQSDLIGLYLENAQNFKFIGTENINGKKAYKLQGTLSGKPLTHAMNSISVLPGNILPDTAIIDSVVEEIQPISFEVWVDKETLHPVQYSMDMASAITYVLENKSPAASTVSISKASVVMTFKNINQATPFDIPPEALEPQS